MTKANPVRPWKFLGGLDYPASEKDLIERAEQEGPDENVRSTFVRSTLERLADQNYETAAGMSKAIGDG